MKNITTVNKFDRSVKIGIKHVTSTLKVNISHSSRPQELNNRIDHLSL